jgi:alpha-glucosidase
MPAVWDETRILEGSKIGTFVAFARRSGEDWYVAVLNCQEKQKTYSIPLAFLGEGDYEAALYQDAPGPHTSVKTEAGHSVQKEQTISVRLKSGGGFVGTIQQAQRVHEIISGACRSQFQILYRPFPQNWLHSHC